MNCEFLPIVGNHAGDWLCIRFDEQSRAGQIVQWYHGAGDWIPWGASLPEAFLLDALIDQLPGSSRRHAEPAENPRPATNAAGPDPFLAWALDHLPQTARELVNHTIAGAAMADQLLRENVAEVAVRCDLVVGALNHSDRVQIHALLGDQVTANQRAEWSFDFDRIPEPYRARLQQVGIRAKRQQDWDTAYGHARRVTEIAPDLAWAWEICGYVAERRSDPTAAVQDYQRASQCSVFTDQSIRLETHWSSDQFAKFSVSRIHHLQPDAVAQSDYYQALKGPDVRQRRIKAREYWLRQASSCEQRGDIPQMHRCLTAAAWDVGVDSITAYAKLLEQIANAAAESKQMARAELARTHRRCLRDRFGW
jgi:tetratricopeptide (TPR) repeat protein